jgi:hypothetical protein
VPSSPRLTDGWEVVVTDGEEDAHDLGSCRHSTPFHRSLHLDGLPFSSTRRPQPPRIQSLGYPVQCPNASRSDLEYDRQDVVRKLVALSYSGRLGASLRDSKIRSIAKLHTTTLRRSQGGPRPLRDHLPFVLSNRTQNVDRELVCVRHVHGQKSTPASIRLAIKATLRESRSSLAITKVEQGGI